MVFRTCNTLGRDKTLCPKDSQHPRYHLLIFLAPWYVGEALGYLDDCGVFSCASHGEAFTVEKVFELRIVSVFEVK